MTTVAEVQMWGTSIGAVALEENSRIATFEYSKAFVRSGIELSPIVMPLSRQLYRFPALPAQTFRGLPGMLADALPDRFGNALIDAWLAGQGRTPESFNPVERLCYTGSRGMGALEFIPSIGPDAEVSQELQVDRLVSLASEILSQRERMQMVFHDQDADTALQQILKVGTSAGGARAKAVIAWHPGTGEVRSGQTVAPPGFEHWILKFDGVQSNQDRELADPKGYGAIEFAYHLMARDAGITMMPCRLLEENGRRHFMTRRFDRTPDGDKIHMQSLGAIAHLDYNAAGAHGYEQAFLVARQLGLNSEEREQIFKRMLFNLVARNQDDHVKNISFLMNRTGKWTLSPAYDVTYAYQPDGRWTGAHQMSVNGKRDKFVWEDLKRIAQHAGLIRGRAKLICEQIQYSVSRWPIYADEAGIPEQQIDLIGGTLRRWLRP